jgi:hypothetical protein
MGKHALTLQLLDEAVQVLANAHPQTVRQVFYQLVVRQVLENSLNSYKKVSRLLADGRLEGAIPWAWVEDRNRRPRHVQMWRGPQRFLESVLESYRRDVWASQPCYVEVWLEKDALSGIVQDVSEPYGVTLCVGRGYDGWSSVHWAAERYRAREAAGQPVHVIYLGDHDPSGEDMVRSLRERLARLGCTPDIRKRAITAAQIEDLGLPPAPTKATDSRSRGFVATHGDATVELDALPVQVLRDLLEHALGVLLDMEELALVELAERDDRDFLKERLQ